MPVVAGIGIARGAVIAGWVRAAELGLWDVPEPWSFADRKEDHLHQLDAALRKGEIDPGLQDLLLALNSHPRVCTSCSCRGHDGEDGSIQMHTDDGGLSRRLKRTLADYRDEGAREWDHAYSEPGDWFVTVSVPAAEEDFRSLSARLLGALGIERRIVTHAPTSPRCSLIRDPA